MTTNRDLIARYWAAMETNDWAAASLLLDPDFTLDYPQSGEHFRGRAAFIAMNADYPVAGRWSFAVGAIVAEGAVVVADVAVTDGARHDRVIAFFTVRDGLIAHLTEYWPEPFAAPAWRAGLRAG